MKGEKRISRTLVLQLVLAALCAGLLVAGLARGEALDVMRKAIMICLECIGIG